MRGGRGVEAVEGDTEVECRTTVWGCLSCRCIQHVKLRTGGVLKLGFPLEIEMFLVSQ